MLKKISSVKWVYFAYLGLLISILGTLGSLYYSEIMLVPICPLCWYQRICMYPLVIVFFLGILLRDRKCFFYALPLIFIGLVIAFYQVLLQSQVLPDYLIVCKSSHSTNIYQGVSCADITFKLFGLFTIPMQALVGFIGLGVVGGLGLVGDEV
jgi:disulfide bond formation protein DsbB